MLTPARATADTRARLVAGDVYDLALTVASTGGQVYGTTETTVYLVSWAGRESAGQVVDAVWTIPGVLDTRVVEVVHQGPRHAVIFTRDATQES